MYIIFYNPCYNYLRSCRGALHYLCSEAVDEKTRAEVEAQGWRLFEKQDPLTKCPCPEGGVFLMPGAGMARPIWDKCQTPLNVPVVMMLLYCSEGMKTQIGTHTSTKVC